MFEPIGLEGLSDFDVVLKIGRLDHERIGSELIRLVDVSDVIGGGEDYHAQRVEARLMADPAEDFEAVHAWHFEIQQEKVRQWIFVADCVATPALEIVENFVATFDSVDGIGDVSSFKGLADDQDVVFGIISDEDNGWFRHNNVAESLGI
jgi:hypothetical protein